MPTVHAKALLAPVEPIRFNLLEPTVRGTEFHVAITCEGILKVIRTTEVILCARAADGWVLRIAVHKELDFALTPPSVIIDAPCHIGAHIVATALYAIENRVVRLIRQRIGAAELCMEVHAVLRDIFQ